MNPTIKFMRWIFLMSYIITVLAICFLCLNTPDVEKSVKLLIITAIFVVTQILFLIGTGTKNFCKPLKKRRLLIPVIVASLMMSVLVAGLSWALMELFKLNNIVAVYFWLIVVSSWFFWGLVFFVYAHRSDRYRILVRLVSTVIVGSWLQLLITIPSHIVVSRRPGCFVGFQTAAGIIAGIVVMFWAFGPGIMLLFLKEKQQAEIKGKKVNLLPGLRKAVFYTTAILTLLTSAYFSVRFLAYEDMREVKALSGYFLCLFAFLVVLVGSGLTVRKKQLGSTLFALASSLICPGLIFLVLGTISNKNFVEMLSDSSNKSILVEYYTNISLPYLWMTIVLLIPMVFLSLKILSKMKADRQTRKLFVRRFTLFAIASACIGFSVSTFTTTMADLARKESAKAKQTRPSCRDSTKTTTKEEIIEGKPFPDLKFTSLDGRMVDINEMKGKVVLINFWATWCSPCHSEITTLVSLYREYREKGLEIIGISLDREKEKLEKFLTNNNVSWPQYFDGKGWQNTISSRFSIHKIPTIILVDAKGKILSNDLKSNNLQKTICSLFNRKMQDFSLDNGGLIGTWVNLNHNTRRITKARISKENEQIWLEVWGKCHPVDCYWGKESLCTFGENVSDTSFIRGMATYVPGFKRTVLILSYEDERLIIESLTEFTDDSDRSNYYSKEVMRRMVKKEDLERLDTKAISAEPPSLAILESCPNREELEGKIAKAKKTVETYRGGHVIVGRVMLEGPGDVRDVKAQMEILPQGYFAGATKDLVRPVGFRMHQYAPYDLHLRGVKKVNRLKMLYVNGSQI